MSAATGSLVKHKAEISLKSYIKLLDNTVGLLRVKAFLPLLVYFLKGTCVIACGLLCLFAVQSISSPNLGSITDILTVMANRL